MVQSPPSPSTPSVHTAPDPHPLRDLEPMDPQLTSIQPGSGVIVKWEAAWGAIRRWYLRTFRKSYVERMRLLRKGDRNPCPHDVLDPRDVKFYRNQQGGYYWLERDDPFYYRNHLPFVRVGLAELIVSTVVLLSGIGIGSYLAVSTTTTGLRVLGGAIAAACLIVLGLIVWFFRNPRRTIPRSADAVISPADGTIAGIERIEHDQYIGGPAILIGVFLSIFNVHVNRAPRAARVIGLTYRRGKFLNALKPESARENEQLAIRIQESDFPYRPMIIRQISGAIARRIVCWLKPGDRIASGENFGMIKFGSRTELLLPDEPGLEILCQIGDAVKAGHTVLAKVPTYPTANESRTGPRSQG